MINYSAQDIERLRNLGRRVGEIAALPVQEHNRALWTAVNDLRQIRPVLHTRDTPVFVLNVDGELTTRISDPFLRDVELGLLLRLYEWEHLRLDRYISKIVYCPCVIHDSGWGLPTSVQGNLGENDRHFGKYESQHFDKHIASEDDVEKIKYHEVSYDEEATMERLNLMHEIFDGILEVRLLGKNYFRVCPWDDIMTWLGMGDALMNFYVDPDMMHACIRRYMDVSIDWVKKYEALGLLSSNNCFDVVLHNGPGFTTELPAPTESGIGCRLKDIWGAASDQILTSVSPEMTQEFAYDYEREYSQLFGKFGIGCCERIDQRVPHILDTFKNVRQISVSPFSKLEESLEAIGNKAVACFKPNSNFLILDNWEEAKSLLTGEMRNALNLGRKYGSQLTINMKTIIHLCDEPQRLWWWCDMASKMINAEYGE
ncbi:MAG: hypothetical protein ACOX81_09885 [Candidatus Heteroscillospira sp.]|jgi:hypothetical protein